MALSPLAGKPAPDEIVIDIEQVRAAYYDVQPDPSEPTQRVGFGTSGHRGSPLDATFNEAHILAVTQAIVEYRQREGINGPLYLGKDSHAVSLPAERSALEVLAANGVTVCVSPEGLTPTPALSHAILGYNRGRSSGLADGIVITPSHNPPVDGGFKYNPPNGGPADTNITKWVQDRANELMAEGNRGVKRISYEQALRADHTHRLDFITPYVNELNDVLDMDAIRSAGVKIGVDPMGGAAVGFWEPIAAKYGLDLSVVNPRIDESFRFMTVDHDGKIRMDCSSPYAMASLVGLKDQYQIAFGNDTDADRHGIVTPSVGLMNPNHYLAVAIWYLYQNRPEWAASAKIGKTLVSSSLIDRVAADLGRELYEVPVGFKWFVDGLVGSWLGFGGEESAGASFLRRGGGPWSTDKDGLILGLLAAEICARTGRDPGEHYAALTARLGSPFYTRVDSPASPEQKARLGKLAPADVKATELAGDAITARMTSAPGNGASIGGLKITTANGWFAARPSGTENVYKVYAESFVSADHLQRIVREASEIVNAAL